MKHRLNSFHLALVIVLIAFVIVIISVWYANQLVNNLRNEEQQRVEIWAEATRHLIQAEPTEDITFYLSIIEANNNIPVYLLDSVGEIMATRNVDEPVEDPTGLYGPIELRLSDTNIQHIYYDDSQLLSQLKKYPYIELGIVLLFVVVAVVAMLMAHHSEQNRVWAGLSKETAHQLGTPISSLVAWQELLRERYPDDELIPQMEQDIQRLSTIADRFSKVGSIPTLSPVCVGEGVQAVLDYFRPRVSSKVCIRMQDNLKDNTMVQLCVPLFSWVMENLIKNALDAMNGKGDITIAMSEDSTHVLIDVTDTGRGIERKNYRTVFQPGYTSKTRGWGLGLSLSKRIIEDYHRGKIFVKTSELGAGTTIRIILKKSKDS